MEGRKEEEGKKGAKEGGSGGGRKRHNSLVNLKSSKPERHNPQKFFLQFLLMGYEGYTTLVLSPSKILVMGSEWFGLEIELLEKIHAQLCYRLDLIIST